MCLAMVFQFDGFYFHLLHRHSNKYFLLFVDILSCDLPFFYDHSDMYQLMNCTYLLIQNMSHHVLCTHMDIFQLKNFCIQIFFFIFFCEERFTSGLTGTDFRVGFSLTVEIIGIICCHLTIFQGVFSSNFVFDFHLLSPEILNKCLKKLLRNTSLSQLSD